MGSQLSPVVLSPGIEKDINIPLQSAGMRISNTSPYDLELSGYGVIGDDVLAAGLENIYYGNVYDSGVLKLTFVNNKQITPPNPGVVLLVVYYSQIEIPKGTWPTSVPQSVVQSVGAGTAIQPFTQNNIGYAAFTVEVVPTTLFFIYPSSYIGLSVAPTSIGGLGYDHFYSYQNPTNTSTMVDLPGGIYGTSTGKTANNATPNNINLMSFAPGPFSQPGPTPVDTATHCNGTHWGLTTAIPWASSTSGYLVEAWIKLDKIATGGFQPIFGDDGSGANNAGVTFYVDQTGKPAVTAGFSGSHFGLVATQALPSGWVYVAWQYTGTVTNTFNIYINGQLAGTGTTNGTPVNTVQLPRIGASFDLAGELFGSIAYVGVLLSGPGTGQGSPAARYEHGLQSLNVDYQNAWLKRVDISIDTLVANTSDSLLTVANARNTAGLMYAVTPSAADIFHIYKGSGNTSFVHFPPQAANQFTPYSLDYYQPLTHHNEVFIELNTAGFTASQNTFLNIQGYNILGVG